MPRANIPARTTDPGELGEQRCLTCHNLFASVVLPCFMCAACCTGHGHEHGYCVNCTGQPTTSSRAQLASYRNDYERCLCPHCHRCNQCSCVCDGSTFEFHTPPHINDLRSQIQATDYARRSAITVTLARAPLRFWKDSPVLARKEGLARFVALEIEVCGAASHPQLTPLDLVRRKWVAGTVHDGSLPQGGFEIQTSPCNGRRLTEQIQDWGMALAAQRAFVTSSAGLHCHADARDYTWYDLRRLVFGFSKVENLLFLGMVGSRRGSNYCAPISPELPKLLRQYFYPATSKTAIITDAYGRPNMTEAIRAHHYEPSRYHSLNLHAWNTRKTVENRMHHGSVDPEVMLKWAKLWGRMVQFCYQASEKEVESLPANANGLGAMVGPDLQVWWEERVKFMEANPAFQHTGDELADKLKSDTRGLL